MIVAIISIFVLVVGIPLGIIDRKHRMRKAYELGHAWGYYRKLSKQGSWEGKFMVWSTYFAIGLLLALIADSFFLLSR